MEVRMNGYVKDVPLIDVTASNYIVPDNEKNVFHCKIEIVKFDSNTGLRLSKPRIQKFGAKMYDQIAHELKRQGYTIEVLHNPKEYAKEEEARKAEEAARKEEAARQAEEEARKAEEAAKIAEEEARKAEIDAAVAAALAEQEKKHEAELKEAVAAAKAEKKAKKAAKTEETEQKAE